jgi:hypothetical protein
VLGDRPAAHTPTPWRAGAVPLGRDLAQQLIQRRLPVGRVEAVARGHRLIVGPPATVVVVGRLGFLARPAVRWRGGRWRWPETISTSMAGRSPLGY